MLDMVFGAAGEATVKCVDQHGMSTFDMQLLRAYWCAAG